MKHRLQFTIKKLFRIALLLLGVSLTAFLLMDASPLDPLQTNIGQAALGSMSPEQIARLEEYWGVGAPAAERYLNWLGGALRGDFGVSLLYRRPVLEVMGQRLANSLWLRDGMTYSQDTLDTLAKDYYAASFSGPMGAEEYNQALRDWINEQTHGLLEMQAQGLEMNSDTVLALASTLYFKAGWKDEFKQDRTKTDTFHAPSGDVDADFMHQTITGSYYWGDNFTAVQLRFQQGGFMWLLLPAEGCSVDELLDSGEAMEFLLAPKANQYDDKGNVTREGWAGQKHLDINLSIPKFDVSSDLSLVEGLKALGVTDVFDSTASNFDPLGASTSDPLYVSQVQHAARVKVDEEGCEAAAYTVISIENTAAMMPGDEVDFTLDRPFLFAVTGDSGLPLFVGNVNQPNG